ncbi:MAG: acyl-CoA carboxylase subunit epsilon [Actinobacteria bacterium]|nr:acyl-CoA carboxylase subunit epsilon [Actinomycetota bacterium]NBP91800.1 acyl-CoA carboxylase subunit epsilon [Actinomycetota bacterium]
MAPENSASSVSGFQISGNPTPEEVAAIVAAMALVSARRNAEASATPISHWGRPIMRTPLSGAWGSPQFH